MVFESGEIRDTIYSSSLVFTELCFHLFAICHSPMYNTQKDNPLWPLSLPPYMLYIGFPYMDGFRQSTVDRGTDPP